MLLTSINGLPAFIMYLATAAVLCMLFVRAYTAITPNPEIELMRSGNRSAALATGASLVGFAIPLASAIFHSASLVDVMVWGVVALLTQLLAFYLARLALPALGKMIAQDDITGAIWVGCVSISAGILNAACMSS
ncbi:MAG: hypothetical protein JWL62_1925 [Hyphomicrobiales bacterium]|jgi:putative membrane protein|nr:hypothetical protein [Hyphomicrobiales bacterium]